MTLLTRRALVAGAGLALAGCDRVIQNPTARSILFSGEKMQLGLQRALTDRTALAPEYAPSQMSPVFRSNGNATADTPEYKALLATRFADYRLEVGGLVTRPLKLAMADLRALPQRAQITRHDCVEGWSAIGKWQGPTFGSLLRLAGPRPAARYVMFSCFDLFGGANYYESIDLVDAWHPQTILAWLMNDRLLSVSHGAPLRLRVERQLGYKQAKYIKGITLVDSLAAIGKGKGGFWEDNVNYDWYAGI